MSKKLYIILKIFIFIFAIFIIGNICFYVYAYITPKLDLKTANQIQIYDKYNNLVFENLEGNKWVELDKISKNIINATISVEDKNFYKHHGFDYLRIVKSLFTNIINNSRIGASTISQQYIKNLYLTFDQTWERKIEEAVLTLELEVHYNKDEILEGYLNTINYGGGNYGIEAASQYYFNKPASDISLAEATILVGIPKNPSFFNPIINYKNAKKRQKVILNSMVRNKLISKSKANKIYKEKLEFYGKKNSLELASLPYYRDAVLNELDSLKQIPKSLIETKGLKIYTNLDVNVQKTLENVIDEEIKDQNDLQVAAIVVDVKKGKVLALIGGKEYSSSQYNRVTQAKRQVGSTIKPFLYYSALEKGFTASSTFTSEPTTFNIGNNKIYSPKNYGEVYANKEISLASAIAFSDNIYAIKTHLFLGENNLVEISKRVGINTPLEPNPSLPFGTNEISMLDYSNGYLTLANYGTKKKAYLINKVTDINDKVLYEYKNKEETILNKKYVFILNELLSNTYNYSFVDYTSPTMLTINNLLTKKYAIKSGSTDKDYWAIGYNPDILVMVWNGYDDNRSLERNQGKVCKRIWARTIEEVLKEKDASWYEIPNGITASLVNPISGKIDGTNNTVLMYYVKGTEPEVALNIFNPQN